MRRVERVDENPNMERQDMDHWKVTLEIGKTGFQKKRRRLTVYFSKGYGHNGTEPNVDEVLDCLASDSTAMDMSFEDFCSEFGYDMDSRKAEATFKACVRIGKNLARFLGDDLLKELVYEVERL